MSRQSAGRRSTSDCWTPVATLDSRPVVDRRRPTVGAVANGSVCAQDRDAGRHGLPPARESMAAIVLVARIDGHPSQGHQLLEREAAAWLGRRSYSRSRDHRTRGRDRRGRTASTNTTPCDRSRVELREPRAIMPPVRVRHAAAYGTGHVGLSVSSARGRRPAVERAGLSTACCGSVIAGASRVPRWCSGRSYSQTRVNRAIPRNIDGDAGTGGSVSVRFQVSDESWIPESSTTVGEPRTPPQPQEAACRPSPMRDLRPPAGRTTRRGLRRLDRRTRASRRWTIVATRRCTCDEHSRRGASSWRRDARTGHPSWVMTRPTAASP